MNHFVDTHAHLYLLEHATADEAIARAKAQGVTTLISVSTEEGNWAKNRDYALANDNLFYSVGLHPHDATKWPEVAPKLDAWFAKGVPPKCVGVGEMGLDYYYDKAPRDAQMAALEGQFAVARRTNLPVILHCRESFDDLFGAIRRVGLAPKRPGIMHCFTGGPDEARKALDLGLWISFSGILTFKNAENIRQAAKIVPADRILLETDCPFLAPIPNRGKPNEPSYLPHTALVLAQARGETLERVAELTTANAKAVFQLP